MDWSMNQMKSKTLVGLLLAMTMLLAACSGGAEDVVSSAPTAPTVAVDGPAPTAVAQPAPTEAPAEVPTEIPAEAPAETPTETPAQEAAPTSAPAEEPVPSAPVDWTETVTVEGDYYVLGNPAAPIRLIDYSDFL